MPSTSSISGRLGRSTQPCRLPEISGLEIAARYREPRIGGDFFDFAGSSDHIVFVLTDIAGDRGTAQAVAAEVQDAFQQHAANYTLADAAINASEATVELLHAINRAIMSASGGVRCAPTFLGIYNLGLHSLTYIGAGAPAALLLSNGQVRILESNGIPLGLFTHLTHDPLPIVMESGSRLVLLSKGVLERRRREEEFGMDRVLSLMLHHQDSSAAALSDNILSAAEEFGAAANHFGLHSFAHVPHFHHSSDNEDMTVITLARIAA
jgi:serine phosphatase RsbU (regulator of sigma subunit)